MADRNLGDLVRRRLFELGLTAEEASRRSRGAVPRETIRGLARGQLSVRIGDGLALALARALGVPAHRVRRAAGLPPVPDARESITTRPHLRVVRDGEHPPPPRPRLAPPGPERSKTGPQD